MKKFFAGVLLAVVVIAGIGAAAGLALRRDANLSDVADAATARSNLGANDAANLTTGFLPDARLSANVTLLGSTIDLASEVTGTLPDARLTANVSLFGSSVDLISEVTGWPANSPGVLENNGAGVLSWNIASASLTNIDDTATGVFVNGDMDIGTNTFYAGTIVATNVLFATNAFVGTTIDYNLGAKQSLDISGNTTITGFENFNPTNESTVELKIKGDASSSFTFTIPDSVYTTDGLRVWTITNATLARFTVSVWGIESTNATLNPLW